MNFCIICGKEFEIPSTSSFEFIGLARGNGKSRLAMYKYGRLVTCCDECYAEYVAQLDKLFDEEINENEEK